MQRTTSGTLVIWAVAGTLLGVLVDVLLESQGFALPGQPWFAIIGMLILAVVLLVLGYPIKRWNDGDRTREIDPLQAARVAVMAKTSALTGAGLAGWYLATPGTTSSPPPASATTSLRACCSRQPRRRP